jgi:tRNA dimethylallyltransferase
MSGLDGHPPAFLAILGPTAVGKTGLSLAVARRLGVEIISMDSRQIYRGMDIGTGKATAEERSQVPHLGLDIRDPDEHYSAGEFARDARVWIGEIAARERVPLLVGGTGFFLRALIQPMFPEPSLDRKRRGALRLFLNGLSLEDLLRFVSVLDPDLEGGAASGGRQRAARIVEMALLTGRPLSWWHLRGSSDTPPLRGVITVLDLPRRLLYERINRRVRTMVEEGLVEEVQALLERGFDPEDPGMTGAGYREMVAFLRGEISLEEAVEEIQQSHRRYARRQLTWNRHQLPEEAVFLDATRPPSELVGEILDLWDARTSLDGNPGADRDGT